DVGRLLDPNSDCTHLLGDAREVDLAEGPHFPRLLGLRPAIDAVEAALRLVAARIVVDHRDGVDAPARGGLDLGDVVPETRVAFEGDHRPVRTMQFCAQACRELPAEVAGAPAITLPRTGEIVHPAHPHAGVAGIDHDHAVIRYVARELGADAFRADGCGVGGQ